MDPYLPPCFVDPGLRWLDDDDETEVEPPTEEMILSPDGGSWYVLVAHDDDA